jgi:hypothetical protein
VFHSIATLNECWHQDGTLVSEHENSSRSSKSSKGTSIRSLQKNRPSKPLWKPRTKSVLFRAQPTGIHTDQAAVPLSERPYLLPKAEFLLVCTRFSRVLAGVKKTRKERAQRGSQLVQMAVCVTSVTRMYYRLLRRTPSVNTHGRSAHAAALRTSLYRTVVVETTYVRSHLRDGRSLMAVLVTPSSPLPWTS